jgi:hypothetical protein
MCKEICDLCESKKLVWNIFNCSLRNEKNSEICPCKNCIVLMICTRLCHNVNQGRSTWSLRKK